MQHLQFCLSEDCEAELLSSLIRKPVNSSPGLLEKKKNSDVIHQLDRKYFIWKYFYSTTFLKISIVFLLFGILNDHNCMAQPAFVPGGKDLVPQNSLFFLIP